VQKAPDGTVVVQLTQESHLKVGLDGKLNKKRNVYRTELKKRIPHEVNVLNRLPPFAFRGVSASENAPQNWTKSISRYLMDLLFFCFLFFFFFRAVHFS
jgi:hypothetical protein